VKAIAAGRGCAPSAVAIAYPLSLAGVNAVVAGARSPQQLHANIEAAAVRLGDYELATLGPAGIAAAISVSEMEFEVGEPSGLHARPAAAFAAAASSYESSVVIQNLTRGTGPVNAKSVVGLLTLGVNQGHRVRIRADGPDAEFAVAYLGGILCGPTSSSD
jgi:phosphotransferase system HPr (HPr) family protein